MMLVVWVPLVMVGQTVQAIQIVNTVEVVTDGVIPFGTVVSYDEAEQIYTISSGRGDPKVFGVTAERPALVYVTAATALPVVQFGTAEVLVSMENGPISRGDFLTTGTESGRAIRANDEDQMIFAIALEASSEAGLLLASVGVEQARAVRAERAAITAAGGIIVSMTRAVIAALLVLGAIGFLLYSFRSIMTTGVISIGRNPRARQSVFWVAVGSMVLAIVLTGLVVFVAIGILILPV